MADSFWVGGGEEHMRALGEHYASRLVELKSKLEGCTDVLRRAQIEAEISRTQAEYGAEANDGNNLY